MFEIYEIQRNYYTITYNNEIICNEQFLYFLSDTHFIEIFTDFLKEINYSYSLIFCEFRRDTLYLPFVFKIKETTFEQETSYLRYKQYISKDCGNTHTIIIISPSGTNLIVPCPYKNLPFGHIDEFIQNAPLNRIYHLFVTLQEYIYTNYLNQNKNVFVYTHGLDVPWLHIRLESPYPKYNVFSNFDKIQELLCDQRSKYNLCSNH